MTQIITVKLAKLIPGEKAKGGSINSRKADAPIDGLAKSIEAHGLLVPLLVRKADNGSFYVLDGNRRLKALQSIKIDDRSALAAIGIPCIEHTHNNALELSMVVNVDRAELHPVDQFEVFAELIQAGDTVDAIAQRYNLKIPQVRQALALSRMAIEVRDAWRNGKISADIAEAFTVTTDHKAQAAALKKVGKNPHEWDVRRALVSGDGRISSLLHFVGRDVYQKAGFEINETLFGENDNVGETVSDLPALKRLADDKIDAKCTALVEDGWKWAMSASKKPNDLYAWKRIMPVGGKYSKEQTKLLGCIVGYDYHGNEEIVRGYVKPGDKGVSIPKSPKEKKAAAKQREERKEQSGGVSDALAFRLSRQLTSAVRHAFSEGGVRNDDIMSFAIATLACADGPFKVTVHTADHHSNMDRQDNDFVKYFRLARSKSHIERCEMLGTWLANAIDMNTASGKYLMATLHPDKDDDKFSRVLVEAIAEPVMKKAMLKQFDVEDYFNSVSKELIVEAVTEALGKEHAARVSKMKAGEAAEYAIKNIKGWVPQILRLGKA
jgi:ParB/RepB/Spo0J family partition protein